MGKLVIRHRDLQQLAETSPSDLPSPRKGRGRGWGYLLACLTPVQVALGRALGSFGLLCALLALLAACAIGTTSAPCPPAQQVLRYPIIFNYGALTSQAAMNLLDPFFAGSMGYSGGINASIAAPVELIYPRLVEYDARLGIVPGLATAWTISPDGKTYTFTLQPGATWSDGTPIDANAVAFALDRAASPCLGDAENFAFAPLKDAQAEQAEQCAYGANGANGTSEGKIKTLIGDSVIVQGPQTLVLKLAQPTSWFLSVLAMPYASIVPRQLVEQYPSDWFQHLSEHPLGGNLFNITAIGQNGSVVTITTRRNAGYWGQKPTLQEIDFIVYPNAQSAATDVRAGKLDIGYPLLSPSASLPPASHQVGLPSTTYDLINWARAPFNDVGMRQAFALALNKSELVRQVYGVTAQPTNNIVPVGIPGANSQLTGPGGAGVGGNLTEARTLEQQYAQTHCKGQVSTCPPVKIGYISGSVQVQALAQAQAAQWQAAFPGYPVAAVPIYQPDLLGLVPCLSCTQLVIQQWIADYADPFDWLQNFIPGSPINGDNVNDPGATALIDAAVTAPYGPLARQDEAAAEQILVNDVAEIPLEQDTLTWQMSAHLTGFAVDPLGVPAISTWQHVAIVPACPASGSPSA